MKRFLCMAASSIVLVLTICSLPGFAGEMSIPDAIKKMKQSNEAINDMRCTFIKKIYKEGRIIPETSMTFKYQKQPETLFVEFINRKKGQKCLYVRGQNDDMLIVRPSGFFKFLTVKVDPNGEQAMEESLSPMTGMDFGSVITNFERLYTKVSEDARVKKTVALNVSHRGKTLHALKIDSEESGNGYFYMYIDPETFLPYEISYEFNGNNAIYTYRDLEINPSLEESDFTV